MRYLHVVCRRYIFRGILFCALTVTAGTFILAAAVDVFTFHLTVVSRDSNQVPRVAALQLAEATGKNGLRVAPAFADRPGEQSAGAAAPDLLVMPLRSLAIRVPALEILELPFLFPDIDAVHKAFDGTLGRLLREEVRQQGWELLALWDEGMQALSGNRRYDRAINLTGMEFVLLRPDPVAEKHFRALDAWTRQARPQTREQLLRECMIGSRSATLQQLWEERLDRVHLAVSLTAHRYEGWVVIAPVATWNKRSEKDRAVLLDVLSSMTPWQRADARQREEEALQKLADSGMHVHKLTAAQRAGFLERLPVWDTLLSDSLSQSLRQELVTAATTGTLHRASGKKALPKAKPETPGG